MNKESTACFLDRFEEKTSLENIAKNINHVENDIYRNPNFSRENQKFHNAELGIFLQKYLNTFLHLERVSKDLERQIELEEQKNMQLLIEMRKFCLFYQIINRTK